MRGNEFLDKMELVDPAFVEAADQKKKKHHFAKWISLAACLAFLVFVSVKMIPGKPPAGDEDLPVLEVSGYAGGDFGYEVYEAADISDLVNANPWQKTPEISRLPVYKNNLMHDESFIINGGIDKDAMKELLLDAAKRADVDTKNTEIMLEEREFEPIRMRMEADGITVEADQGMRASMFFEPALALPEEYSFTSHMSYEEASKIADYLKEHYKKLIGFQNPKVNICGGDYHFDGEQSYSIEFYDGSGNSAEDIVNYNFNRVVFYGSEDGGLSMVSIYAPKLTQKAGDYPVITEEKARELLKNGTYFTSVPYAFTDTETIAKTELIYRTGDYEEYYMPYYRFYVEIPEETMTEGMKAYGTYYVPAVEGEYLSNLPVYDGYD